ncbi:MAG: hypothetical protein N3A38_07820 [Planctomycetota bacterium]|nr:hypothetical protein [Planctomycetota bacterium]
MPRMIATQKEHLAKMLEPIAARLNIAVRCDTYLVTLEHIKSFLFGRMTQ